jgi:hypothetical protein
MNIYQEKTQESTFRIKDSLDTYMITDNGNKKIIGSSLTKFSIPQDSVGKNFEIRKKC